MASGIIKQPTNSLSFTVTLDTTWTNNEQTVENEPRFISTGFAYIVSPAATSRTNYLQADIYADEVSTNGEMTFHCSAAPGSEITVNILRVVTG